jgi:hypothetical protein
MVIVDAVVAGQKIRAIATPWHSNGNILDYVQQQAGVNRLNLVCPLSYRQISNFLVYFQTLDVASGLAYTHSIGLVHGNLHPVSPTAGGHCISMLKLSRKISL